MGAMHAHAVAYYVFGSLGYTQLGTDFEYDRPVTSLLPPGLWNNLANAGLLAHCIVAYMVWHSAGAAYTTIQTLANVLEMLLGSEWGILHCCPSVLGLSGPISIGDLVLV